MHKAFDNIEIVLTGTKYSGNVGSVARAMKNMGLSHLRLANPECAMDDDCRRLARSGKTVLAKAKTYGSLRGALRGIRVTIGTTAKTGGHRNEVHTPRSLTPRILAQAARQKVAIIFGPEDTGLIDEDLKLCQMLIRIPSQPQARSLNLAQAVMIICYELYLGQMTGDLTKVPTLAPVEDVEAMYEHLHQSLLKIGFLHPNNATHIMFSLRRLFGRAGLENSDVSILRGIARQMAWYSVHRKPKS